MQAEENTDLLISEGGGRHKGTLVLYSSCSFLGLHKDVKNLKEEYYVRITLLPFK